MFRVLIGGLLLGLAAVTLANTVEDDQITDFNEPEVKKFYLNTGEKMDWTTAYLHCKRKSLSLPTISNEEEYTQLVNLIKSDNNVTEAGPSGDLGVWTSGYLDSELGRYQWMTRLLPMNFSRWRPGRPDLSDLEKSNCVELSRSYDYLMNDVPCWKENFVSCQNNVNFYS